MNKETNQEALLSQETVLTPGQLLEHWQGHRGLTRRVIEAFPEEHLFSYRIGGMRTFAELASELTVMGAPSAHGIATGEWKSYGEWELLHAVGLNLSPTTKEEILKLWDWSTDYINSIWAQIKPQRFQEVDTAFGQYKGTVWWICFYIIDNEIHHRGQGYVYLRSLGIEPPPFWDR